MLAATQRVMEISRRCTALVSEVEWEASQGMKSPEKIQEEIRTLYRELGSYKKYTKRSRAFFDLVTVLDEVVVPQAAEAEKLMLCQRAQEHCLHQEESSTPAPAPALDSSADKTPTDKTPTDKTSNNSMWSTFVDTAQTYLTDLMPPASSPTEAPFTGGCDDTYVYCSSGHNNACDNAPDWSVVTNLASSVGSWVTTTLMPSAVWW